MGLHNGCANTVLLFWVRPTPEFLLWFPPTAPGARWSGRGLWSRGFLCVRSISSCRDRDMDPRDSGVRVTRSRGARSADCLSTAEEPCWAQGLGISGLSVGFSPMLGTGTNKVPEIQGTYCKNNLPEQVPLLG